MARRKSKPGPKPRLRKAKAVTLLLEGEQLRQLNDYAAERGVSLSAAARELLAAGLPVRRKD